MGIFDLFRKKSPEEVFRNKVRGVFEETVRNKKLTGSMLDGMLLQAAIYSARDKLRLEYALLLLGGVSNIDDWSPEAIIDQECNRVMNKYLR